MRKIYSIFIQDLKQSIRNFFLLFNAIVLLVTVFLVRFNPDFDNREKIFTLNNSDSPLVDEFLQTLNLQTTSLNSEKELIAKVGELEENKGYIFDIKENKLSVKYLHNGTMDEPLLHLVKAKLEHDFKLFLQKKDTANAVNIEPIDLRKVYSGFSVSDSIGVIVLTMQISILGYLFIAVMIFNDKREGFITSYRVTPGGVYAYFFGKILLWVLFTLIYGIIFILLIKGLEFSGEQWVKLSFVLIFSGLFFSSLGMSSALYFNSISDWFVIGIFLIIIFLLPEFHYLNPLFSPGYIKWIPTYAGLKVFQDILMNDTGSTSINFFMKEFGIYTAAIILFVFISLRKVLLKM